MADLQIEGYVRQIIPQIKQCAKCHNNKAAASTLRIIAKTLEEYLPETLKAYQEKEGEVNAGKE